MKFPYLKIPTKEPGKKWISPPIIPVTPFGPRGSITVDALIDSGAYKCLFHTDLGKEIGLELERGEKQSFSGIEEGRIPAFLHKIQLPDLISFSQVVLIRIIFFYNRGIHLTQVEVPQFIAGQGVSSSSHRRSAKLANSFMTRNCVVFRGVKWIALLNKT